MISLVKMSLNSSEVDMWICRNDFSTVESCRGGKPTNRLNVMIIYSVLVNKSNSIIGTREAFRVWVAVQICFDEAEKKALNTHRNPIARQSEQSDNDQEQIDNR